jgi:hypothetical protein
MSSLPFFVRIGTQVLTLPFGITFIPMLTQRATKNATRLSSLMMKNYFIEEMWTLIDDQRKITHDALAEQTEEVLMDEQQYRTLKFPADVRKSY